MSLAKAQNCDMAITLKMPTQMKNTTPRCVPVRPRTKNTTMFAAKKTVTQVRSFSRLTRDAKAPKAGTRTRSRRACPADAYVFTAALASVRISASRTVFSM